MLAYTMHYMVNISPGLWSPFGCWNVLSKQNYGDTYSFTIFDDLPVELKCDQEVYEKLIIDEFVQYTISFKLATLFGKNYGILYSIDTDDIIDNREVMKSALEEITQPGIVYSQLDWSISNCGQTINGSWGISGYDINIIPAWGITKGDPSVIVAVVDTGVDASCDVLQGSLLGNGYDFYNGDDTIYDDYLYDYHGTYIATTIALVAPGIKIMPVKFMESSVGAIEDAVEATRYAIEHGAKIVNMSWNFEEYSKELYELIKGHPEVLFVNAAGNRNINLEEEKLYPCSYGLENIITVMAMDNIGSIYEASGYGVSYVDIAAPGVDVKVIFPENDETTVSGTSVAAAFVSAAAALIIFENDALTPVDAKDIIMSSAVKLDKLKNLCRAGGFLDITACLEHMK